MSLDVYLKNNSCPHCGRSDEGYWANITHNLCKMAEEAGIYEALWRPHRLKPEYDVPDEDYKAEWAFEDQCTVLANEIITPIEKGLQDLKARPDHFKQFDASNGWGTYEQFVPWVEEYLNACKLSPNAKVEVRR